MIEKLKTIKTGVSLGEVHSILAEMNIENSSKNVVLSHLQGIKNSKKKPFTFVYNGIKGNYQAANIAMMCSCNSFVGVLLQMEGLRGEKDGMDFRVINFTNTATREVISWVFQAVS